MNREISTDALAARIGRTLLSEEPDARGLARRIAEEGGLSRADARRLIYGVAAGLNARFFPPLTKMELILTEGCNLACTYCFEKPMRGVRKMRPAVARAAVDLLIEYSGDETSLDVTHFGGEPLLNFATLAAATEYGEERAAAAGKTIDFNITTNGLLLDQRTADYLAGHRIKALLSIDGTAESHDRHRVDGEGRGTFDRAVAALKLLKTRQPWIGAKMTVMPANAVRLVDDVRALYDIGVNQFVIGPATGVPWSDDAADTWGGQLRRLVDWYRSSPRDDLRIADLDGDGETPSAYFGCQAGRDSISVSANGKISSCSKILALDSKKLIAQLGDVRFGLTHLSNRAELAACSRLQRSCEEMGLAAGFNGGCLATNYEENGDLFRPSLQDYRFSTMKKGILAGWREVPESTATGT